ncbi:hypothetical protein CTI12_AA284990 [Artemisia annua]|uniref:Uncharacterized protein n=1 Tax=Artemisia annua TaxID=35608 RepID=A0A2U1N6N6_ARTAN|nr:hypothetical protein CTI12_AA284990 [Artemisia annua]
MGRQTAQPFPAKVNHQHHEDDGRTDSFPRSGRRARVSDFDKVMKDKAFFFFFTNFPESWDSGALWKMFTSRYGSVVDVYIAFKRTKKGSRFGFRCWTGKAKNVQVLHNAWDIMANNGLEDCIIRYVGGLTFLFEWNSKDDANRSMEENMCWIQQWFNDVKPWEEKGELHGRLTWLVIEGLPTLGRNMTAVKTIASRFGKLLEVGRLSLDSNILSPVKTLILTYSMKDIGQPIDVVLNNRTYPVRLFEDSSLNSKFLRDMGSKWHDRSSEDSLSEEEYVGPSMEGLNGDEEPMEDKGGSCSEEVETKGGADEKLSAVQSPRNCSCVPKVGVTEEDNYVSRSSAHSLGSLGKGINSPVPSYYLDSKKLLLCSQSWGYRGG